MKFTGEHKHECQLHFYYAMYFWFGDHWCSIHAMCFALYLWLYLSKRCVIYEISFHAWGKECI